MVGPTGEQDWYVSGVFAMSFINLNDTIGDYVGRGNNLLRVNAAEDGLSVVEFDLENHSARHENGGDDEINVAGLSGVLGDDQNPKNHVSSHEPGGSDELSFAGTMTKGVVRLSNPAGAADKWDTFSETGAIQINLPAVASDMIYFHATVFEYTDQKSFDVIIAGYLDLGGSEWLRATAVITGDSPNVKRVRFCRNSDSSAWFVVIGDTGTSWAYPWIAIGDFKAGHNPAISDWDDGWSMSLITSMPSYTDFDFTDARVSPKDHAGRHANGGEDELDVTGLSGDLADRQNPKNHATRHKDGDADELDASELAGALGYSTQALISDGYGCSWQYFSIGISDLKTSSGSVSTTSQIGQSLTLPGGQYGFYPQLKHEGVSTVFWGYDRSAGDGIEAAKVGGSGYRSNITLSTDVPRGYARQRYVTASGELYWIFILRQKGAKGSNKIISAYQAPDHPCFGNGGDPDIVQHPFPDFDPAKHEILVINPDIAFMKKIYDKTPKSKDLLETLFAEFEIDENVSPKWPDKDITVDLHYNDFPFYEPGEGRGVKGKIPKPGYIKTAAFKSRVKK